MDPATELRRYTSLNAVEHMLRDSQLRLTRVDVLRRDGDRRLLMLTPRDPHDTRPQSFSPFK
jgi:hypothetical protein